MMLVIGCKHQVCVATAQPSTSSPMLFVGTFVQFDVQLQLELQSDGRILGVLKTFRPQESTSRPMRAEDFSVEMQTVEGKIIRSKSRSPARGILMEIGSRLYTATIKYEFDPQASLPAIQSGILRYQTSSVELKRK